MADIDIAAPGSKEDELRSALGGLVGNTILASGELESTDDPISSIQLALPETHTFFRFKIWKLRADTDDSLLIQFSPDGGETWYTGGSDYAQTVWYGTQNNTNQVTTFADIGAGISDLVYFSHATARGFWADVEIDPGAVDLNAQVFSRSNGISSAGGKQLFFTSQELVHVGVQNMMRVSMYDASMENFTRFYYELWGYAP